MGGQRAKSSGEVGATLSCSLPSWNSLLVPLIISALGFVSPISMNCATPSSKQNISVGKIKVGGERREEGG